MVPDLPDCSLKVDDETQTDFTDQEAYLREIIDNNNNKIHKLEQEIEELKRQLQDTQRQQNYIITIPNKGSQIIDSPASTFGGLRYREMDVENSWN